MPEAPVDIQDEVNQREWERLVNWSGWRYSSKLDTRVWVPKRPMTGSGDTINFGHPGARAYVAAMLIVPAVVLLVVVLAVVMR